MTVIEKLEEIKYAGVIEFTTTDNIDVVIINEDEKYTVTLDIKGMGIIKGFFENAVGVIVLIENILGLYLELKQ